MFGFLRRLIEPQPAPLPELSVDQLGLHSLEQSTRLDWRDIRRVTIICTDSGPWAEDLFFVIEGTETKIVVPHEQAIANNLLEHLQKLPGFNNEAVIRAMGCTNNESFTCWSHE